MLFAKTTNQENGGSVFIRISTMEEIWKQIKNLPEYEVSSFGRVKSKKFGKSRILKQSQLKGYLKVSLSDSGIDVYKMVHRLVLETFTGICPEGLEASHLDGNKLNNHIENLIWESGDENRRRRNDVRKVKLNQKKVNQIRNLLDQGWKMSDIGKKFGVTRMTINYIKNNKIWKTA